MRAWVIGVLVSTGAFASEAGYLQLTSGWLSVLDLRQVRAASSDDPMVVTVGSFERDQVVLLGGAPGFAAVTVSLGPPEAPRELTFRVTVTRAASVQPWDGSLTVRDRRVVRVPSLKRVAIGDTSTCDALIEWPDELALVPRRPGQTSLLVWSGGDDRAHRRQFVVTVEAGGVRRNVDEVDAVLTEPLDGRLVLVAGEHALIDADVATRVAVGDEAVARVHGSRRGELLVEARAAGATWLRLWAGSGPPELRFVVVHGRVRNIEPTEPYFEPADPSEQPEAPPEPAAKNPPARPAAPAPVPNANDL